MAETEILELEKTLQVDEQTYNINAVKADKVANSLIVKNIGLTGQEKVTERITFDGSTEESISVVSAETGGKFNRAIRVPSINSEAGSDNLNNEKIHDEAVLNYKDIVGKVVDRLLNTSAMATRDNNELTFTDTKTSEVYGICTVFGAETDVVNFAGTNNANWNAANSENPPDSSSKWLPNYLYICSDTGNIYFGTANSTEVTRLADGENEALEPKYIRIAGKGGVNDKGGYRWVIPRPREASLDYAVYRNEYRDDDGTIHRDGDDSTVDGGLDLSNSDIVNVNGLWFAEHANAAGEGLMFLYRDQAKIPFKLDPILDGDTGRTEDVWDRFYAADGHLYFSVGETTKKITAANDSPSANRHEVFHTGMTIPVENGGTGASTAKDARTSLEITPANIGAAVAGHTHKYAGSDNVGGEATSAKKATNDSDNKQINKNYYRSASNTSDINTITIAAAATYPNGIPSTVGNNGDIIILY